MAIGASRADRAAGADLVRLQGARRSGEASTHPGAVAVRRTAAAPATHGRRRHRRGRSARTSTAPSRPQTAPRPVITNGGAACRRSSAGLNEDQIKCIAGYVATWAGASGENPGPNAARPPAIYRRRARRGHGLRRRRLTAAPERTGDGGALRPPSPPPSRARLPRHHGRLGRAVRGPGARRAGRGRGRDRRLRVRLGRRGDRVGAVPRPHDGRRSRRSSGWSRSTAATARRCTRERDWFSPYASGSARVDAYVDLPVLDGDVRHDRRVRAGQPDPPRGRRGPQGGPPAGARAARDAPLGDPPGGAPDAPPRRSASSCLRCRRSTRIPDRSTTSIDFVAGRVLDLIGVEADLTARWGS